MPKETITSKSRPTEESSIPKVLSLSDLHKAYGRTVAVDGVSFEVGRNEIVGLLGPNGAGKTTIINMILGVLEPTAGTIRVESLDIVEHRRQTLERTNFAAVYTPLPGRFFTRIYNRAVRTGLIARYSAETLS